VAASDDPVDLARRWRVHEEAAGKIDEALTIIATTLLLAKEVPFTRWPNTEPPEINRAYWELFALHRSGAPKRIAAHARTQRQSFQHDRRSKADVWRLTFCADLGFLWRALTGANPARTDPFINFVAAAYESLSDELDPVAWEHVVRRAVELGFDWIHRRK
jgi:hypothetical protein